MVDLEEFIELEFGDILQDSFVTYIPLEQLNLDSFGVVIVFINFDEAARNLVAHRGHSDRQAAEAVSYLVKHVKGQHHDHQWVGPAKQGTFVRNFAL